MIFRNTVIASLIALGVGVFPFAAAEPALAAGCASGALVGGVAGHYAGHHGLAGAIGGCIVGHHMNTVAKRKAAAEARQPSTGATPN